MTAIFGDHAPSRLARAVLGTTTRLPANWLGLRLAIALRRLVTTRLRGGGLDVERFGLRLRLYPGDNGCEKNLLFTPQLYEVTERAALGRAIAQARAAGRRFVFVDIGANVGLFSFFVASHRDAEVDILAVEPEPGNLARLRFNIAANAPLPIRLRAVALGDAAGTARVDLNPKDRGGTTVAFGAAAPAGAGAQVPCLTLLDLLHQEAIASIDALKIDTECTEDLVLAPFFRDAPESLWPRMVIIEDSRHAWRTDVIALMQARGYGLKARSRFNLVLVRA